MVLRIALILALVGIPAWATSAPCLSTVGAGTVHAYDLVLIDRVFAGLQSVVQELEPDSATRQRLSWGLKQAKAAALLDGSMSFSQILGQAAGVPAVDSKVPMGSQSSLFNGEAGQIQPQPETPIESVGLSACVRKQKEFLYSVLVDGFIFAPLVKIDEYIGPEWGAFLERNQGAADLPRTLRDVVGRIFNDSHYRHGITLNLIYGATLAYLSCRHKEEKPNLDWKDMLRMMALSTAMSAASEGMRNVWGDQQKAADQAKIIGFDILWELLSVKRFNFFTKLARKATGKREKVLLYNFNMLLGSYGYYKIYGWWLKPNEPDAILQ